MSKSRTIRALRDQLLLIRNEDFIAINKPLGIASCAGKEPLKSLKCILEQMELVKSSCPIPINSLPGNVSGIQLMSLHSTAGKHARAMIKEGQFWRSKYWAIVSGKIKSRNCQGIVNVPLRDGKIDSDGDPSITHWKLLKHSSIDGLSLIEFEPRTDVLGQIEIHSAEVLGCHVLPELGLHLAELTAFLPDKLNIHAPVVNEFKLKMQSLGWS
jgi:23S rRNA-/tRNA-specific pseudouridylate synthase